MAQGDRTHEGRLSSLEKGYESLQGEIHGLRTDLRGFMHEVRSELGASRRTQWSPIIAGVAVLVAIIGGLSSGPISDIKRIEERQSRMEANRFTDRDGERMAARVERLESALVTVTDEDFNRPEAEAMRADLMTEIRWLRDLLMQNAQADAAAHPGK